MTGSDLLDLIVETDRPVLAVFWTPKTTPLSDLRRPVETLARRLSNRAVVGVLNMDEHDGLADRIGVTDAPTLVVFRDNEPAHALPGTDSIQAFADRVETEVFGKASEMSS
jgi:thioredoxin 1